MDKAILNRINRDMSEGVLVVQKTGEIAFMNASAQEMLAVSNSWEGSRILDIFGGDLQKSNDDFLQCLLDAVSCKTEKHESTVPYVDGMGNKHWFRVTSSFLYDEEKEKSDGVVLCFSDTTEEVLAAKKARDSAILFVLIMSSTCLWILFYCILSRLQLKIDDFLITQIENVAAIITCACILKYTSLTMKDIGLTLKIDRKYLWEDLLLTVILFLAIVAYKLIAGYEGPFWRFDLLGIANAFYPLTVVFQEVLAHSIIQESVTRIMDFRYGKYLAILVTSLQFSVLHIHKGLAYMLGAFFLMICFGFFYARQKSIWATCIPHYILGTAFVIILGFQ